MQVPYFDLVAKLEEKYEGLLEEQKKWNMMLQERQVVIDRIENHIQVCICVPISCYYTRSSIY
jgi:hypothetical protein